MSGVSHQGIEDATVGGISVVICCFNSAARLPQTLAHLQRQDLPAGVPWEVVIVNNASQDDTERVASAHWDAEGRVPMRIVFAAQPGLSYARACGIEQAQYALVALVDDDNWLRENWLATMHAVFQQHPTVVAAGSMIAAQCAVPPPDWFARYQGFYVVGSARAGSGEVAKPLPGAGLCFRKHAWITLQQQGFVSLLSDRKGSELSSGGDHEMSYAFLLNGGKLWFEASTTLNHFIEAKRLTWDYVLRLNRGFGAQSVLLDVYADVLAGRQKRCWWREVSRCCWVVLKLWLQLRVQRQFAQEGNGTRLVFENQCGRLRTLMQRRRDYATWQADIAGASWNQQSSKEADRCVFAQR